MVDPTYGRCFAPQCRYWANRCNANYCQLCCDRIHTGVTWSHHTRPDGGKYVWSYKGVHSALPVHYGGQDLKTEIAVEDLAPPVVGTIEDVTDEGKIILPVKDNSYFTPRGGTSGFPVQYDK